MEILFVTALVGGLTFVLAYATLSPVRETVTIKVRHEERIEEFWDKETE